MTHATDNEASQTKYSKCCLSSVRLYSGEEGTNFYICNACDKACDVTNSQTGVRTPDPSESKHQPTPPRDIEETLDDELQAVFEAGVLYGKRLAQGRRIVDGHSVVTKNNARRAILTEVRASIIEAQIAELERHVEWNSPGAGSIYLSAQAVRDRIAALKPKDRKEEDE